MNYHFSVGKIAFNKITLYDHTDIIIPQHGITIIAGSNGCGKTTLLNHILFNNPEYITLVAQENDLIFTDISTTDNIMLLNADNKKLFELLQLFRLEYILDRNPKYLSGGEKRIIAILRMFFVDNDIVFLDEPTNDLDYRSVETIKAIISELAKYKSLLIVTHDERISTLANKVYRFCDGKVISDDAVKNEEFASLVKNEPQHSVGKLINKDIIGNLLFALLMISILVSGIISTILRSTKVEYMKEGQTNIASKFYASPATMVKNGYIPLEAYKAYEGTVDADFLEVYSEHLTRAYNSGGSLNMFLDKNLGENVYLCVFFNTETNQRTYVLKEYQTLRELQTGVSPDISDFITVFDGVNEVADIPKNGVAEEIDNDLYHMMEDAYVGSYSDLQPTFYIVLGLNSSQLDLVDGNIFIKNNTTVDICNSINTLNTFINSIKVLVFGLVGSLLFYFLYFCINTRLYTKHITVLRNIGVPQNSVERDMFAKKCSPIIKINITAVGIAVCVITMLASPDYVLLMSLLAVLCASIGVSVIVISKKILNYYINRVYTFGGIYENKDKC